MPLGRTKKNSGAGIELPAEIVIAIVVAMFLILGGIMYFCPGVDEDSEKDSEKYRVKQEKKTKKRGKRGAGARGGRGPPPTETTVTVVAQPPTLTFQVEVPAGVDPGAQMTVPAPDGSLVTVIVPDGLTPGSLFAVAMAPPAPLPPPPPEAPQPFAGHGIV